MEQGGAVMAGAAGVGKTRLAREVTSVLDGWHVAWATATRATSELPLGGVAGLGLADEETPSQGQAGLLSRLAARLAERAGGRPVLLTKHINEQPPPDVVSLYKDGPLPRLELEPLGRQEFGALVSAALGGDIEPGTLHRLWCESAGNVLFLRELVADAVEAGTLVQAGGVWRWSPDGKVGARLAELVADRIGRLEGDRRLLAEVLAVGEPLGAELVQVLIPGPISPRRSGGGRSWL